LLALFQIVAALISIITAVCGVVQLHQNAHLEVDWCDDHDTRDTHGCWTHAFNGEVGLFFFGICIFFFGVLGFVGIMRVKGWLAQLHPWQVVGPFYLVTGALTLGASGNLGIVAGSLSMGIGLLILLFALIAKTEVGPVQLGSVSLPKLVILVMTVLSILAHLGVFATGCVSVATLHETFGGDPLEWCESNNDREEESCWTSVTNPAYALGSFAIALMLLALVGLIANIHFKGWCSFLYMWSILGIYEIVLGFLTMGAAGNTGVLMGAFMCAVGAIKVLIWLFTGDKQSDYQPL